MHEHALVHGLSEEQVLHAWRNAVSVARRGCESGEVDFVAIEFDQHVRAIEMTGRKKPFGVLIFSMQTRRRRRVHSRNWGWEGAAMAVVTDKDLRSRFSFSENEIAQLHADAEKYESGEWPEGETVLIGRPCVYGERMKSITYRDTEVEVRRMDERAKSLSMSRSDYLRYLVRKDLEG